MMDALADGGVYAGIPKDIALKLVAHTMIVRSVNTHRWYYRLTSDECLTPLLYRVLLKWCYKMDTILNRYPYMNAALVSIIIIKILFSSFS